MLLDVSHLLKEPSGSTREYEFDEEVPGDGTVYPVSGRVRLMRTEDGIWGSAPLDAYQLGQFSRCVF